MNRCASKFLTGILIAVTHLFVSHSALAAAVEVTAEQFGAHGDGTSDDTSALQAAINSASSQPGGGAVLLRPVTYVISAPLVITSAGVGLRGSQPGWPGGGGTIIMQRSANVDVVDIIHPQGSYVYGNFVEQLALISGAAWNEDNNTAGSGIFIQAALGTRIRDVVVLNAYMGIHLMGARNVSVQNCNVQRLFHVPAKSYGIFIEDDGVNSNASNWINDTIIAFPANHIGLAYGLHYAGIMQDLTIRHLEINQADIGLTLKKSAGKVNYDVQLSNLIVDQFHQTGMIFEGFEDGSPSVIGGWFANAPSPTKQYAVLALNSNGLKIQGVEFLGYGNANNNSTAIAVRNSTHSILSGNSFRAWNFGIDLDASSNVVVTGNSFVNDDHNLERRSTYDSHVLIQANSNRVSIVSNTFSGANNTKYSVKIIQGAYNLTSSNTWTGPYSPGGGFYSSVGGTNVESGNVGN